MTPPNPHVYSRQTPLPFWRLGEFTSGLEYTPLSTVPPDSPPALPCSRDFIRSCGENNSRPTNETIPAAGGGEERPAGRGIAASATGALKGEKSVHPSSTAGVSKGKKWVRTSPVRKSSASTRSHGGSPSDASNVSAPTHFASSLPRHEYHEGVHRTHGPIQVLTVQPVLACIQHVQPRAQRALSRCDYV